VLRSVVEDDKLMDVREQRREVEKPSTTQSQKGTVFDPEETVATRKRAKTIER
jgi:hypothetical protein